MRFTFKRETPRVTIWKQRGSTKRVEIIKRDLHDDTYARSILTQAGMPLGQIQQFIESASRRH